MRGSKDPMTKKSPELWDPDPFFMPDLDPFLDLFKVLTSATKLRLCRPNTRFFLAFRFCHSLTNTLQALDVHVIRTLVWEDVES